MSISLDLAVTDTGRLNGQMIGHCIGMIKQVLMYSADAEVFGQQRFKDIGFLLVTAIDINAIVLPILSGGCTVVTSGQTDLWYSAPVTSCCQNFLNVALSFSVNGAKTNRSTEG